MNSIDPLAPEGAPQTSLLKPGTFLWALLALSAVFRSVQEIKHFRRAWSWLPEVFFRTDGWMNIDGYHIISNGHWMAAAGAGALFLWCYMKAWSVKRGAWSAAWLVLLIWFAHGLVFDLFYHVLFMKPQYMQNFILLTIQDFFSIF